MWLSKASTDALLQHWIFPILFFCCCDSNRSLLAWIDHGPSMPKGFSWDIGRYLLCWVEYKNIYFFGVEEKIKILNHGTKLFVFFDQIYIQDDIFDHDLLFIQLLLWAHNNNMLRFNLDIGTYTSRRRM